MSATFLARKSNTSIIMVYSEEMKRKKTVVVAEGRTFLDHNALIIYRKITARFVVVECDIINDRFMWIVIYFSYEFFYIDELSYIYELFELLNFFR